MGQVNLHQHSEGSFLDGLARVDEIARRAVEVGSTAVAITDHNEVNQHLAFQKACDAHGIKPLLGMEADWVADLAHTRTLDYPRDRSHICLIAENDQGLSNIWAMSSLAYTDTYRYYKPLLTPDLMREHAAGVLASDGCMLTELGRAVEAGDEDRARQHFATLLDIFGDRFYCELHTWQFLNADTPAKKRLNDLMRDINHVKVRLATQMGVPMVVVNDAHHAWPHQWENQELVWKLSTKKNIDRDDDEYGQKANHLMGADEIYLWMRRHGVADDIVAEAIVNSAAIADRCHARVRRSLDLPRMTASERDDLKELIALTEHGYRRLVVDAGLPADPYLRRIDEELSLIAERKFCGYFLMVRDYVGAAVSGTWSPYVNPDEIRKPMLCGPGRGSAGGCLISYLLGITTLDPLRYGLMFERFLAPGRKDWPDIDVDFPQSMRPDIKSYLESRFGHDHVCTIQTLSRSQPKALVRDLGRAMKIPMADVNAISKIIDQADTITDDSECDDDVEPATWAQVLESRGGDLSRWARKYPALFDRISEMAGMVRQSSRHASGVVVSNRKLLGTIPLRTKTGQLITQFDMYEVEELGAVKLDLLGLRHLDTLMNVREAVRRRHGVWLAYRGDEPVPAGVGEVKTFTQSEFSDPAIWAQVDSGHTVGIFQLETAELTRAGVEMRPRDERDLAVLLSIVRPGVKDAGLDDEYLHRRSGLRPVTFAHPMMADIAGETCGILVYQEQLLRAVKEMAGFTPDQADELRRALGKKKMDKVLEFKAAFLDGCLASPAYMESLAGQPALHARKIAEKIWSSIEASGRYAFNKSHAVGYAIVSTWELWVKHHYPLEYLWALLVTDPEHINRYIREARRLGISVLPPDVNLSDDKFSIENGSIRYGIDAIRGIGSSTAKDIRANRPYRSLDRYMSTAGRGVHKSTVFNLIAVGAFDSVGPRSQLIARLERLRAADKLAQSTVADPQKLETAIDRRMNANPGKYVIDIPDFDDPAVVYQIEKELVGTYITVDPMEPYLEMISKESISDPADIDSRTPGSRFVIGGQVSSVKKIKVSKTGRNHGKEMAFITVEWNDKDFEITVFPDEWQRRAGAITVDAPVLCDVIRDDRGCHLDGIRRPDMMTSRKGM